MAKRLYINSLLLLVLTMILFAPTGCSSEAASILSVDDEGNTSIDVDALEDTINQGTAGQLDVTEQAGIIYMREEEKLARDVYALLYETWGTNVFHNIGSSEETHMDAMKTLIDRYSLTDPAEDMEMGEFHNNELQQLYNELVEQGSGSELDALKVGAAIEEIDIIDIEEYLAQANQPDIITVYESLLKGSRNHLRSFVSVMENRGISYQPQYLTSEQFNEIISSSIERGN